MVVLQISNESAELEELRELKADVDRREKAQAAVLERQAKRLDELEILYKVRPHSAPCTSHILQALCCWYLPSPQCLGTARDAARSRQAPCQGAAAASKHETLSHKANLE